uniref:Uncharacterized protein n=1 Tax=Timema douglasi TaxID=61478 RepID=A0A7R8VNI6_TIMDO|nr:unnamed protein product [Timema douglasi]
MVYCWSRYYNNLRQELPPSTDTVYRHRVYPRGITPQEIQGLQAVLGVTRTVAEYDDCAQVALCENPHWNALNILLGLVSCSVPIPLKAELLLTLAALARSPNTAATLWHSLEASQILTTVPSISSYQPRGVQTELEEIESRNEEFPLTRALLHLVDVLTNLPVPRLLGAGSRTPGFDPYLQFIMNSVFLLGSSQRLPQAPGEVCHELCVFVQWEVANGCLKLLVKFVMSLGSSQRLPQAPGEVCHELCVFVQWEVANGCLKLLVKFVMSLGSSQRLPQAPGEVCHELCVFVQWEVANGCLKLLVKFVMSLGSSQRLPQAPGEVCHELCVFVQWEVANGCLKLLVKFVMSLGSSQRLPQAPGEVCHELCVFVQWEVANGCLKLLVKFVMSCWEVANGCLKLLVKFVMSCWEVANGCLKLLVKFVTQYEPHVEDFVGKQVELQGGGLTQVNPPPGFHLMIALNSKSELIRLVVGLVEVGPLGDPFVLRRASDAGERLGLMERVQWVRHRNKCWERRTEECGVVIREGCGLEIVVEATTKLVIRARGQPLLSPLVVCQTGLERLLAQRAAILLTQFWTAGGGI